MVLFHQFHRGFNLADVDGTLLEFPDGSYFSDDKPEFDVRASGSLTILTAGETPVVSETIREEPMLPRREP